MGRGYRSTRPEGDLPWPSTSAYRSSATPNRNCRGRRFSPVNCASWAVRLQERLEQAAVILEKFLTAGWTTQLAMYEVILLHKDVQTREEAIQILQGLGIDLRELMIVEEIEEDEVT